LLSTGSGFLISSDGHLITNAHVISGCGTVRTHALGADSVDVRVVAIDENSDLALLEGPANQAHPAQFRGSPSPRAGESVVFLGFPLHGLLANEPNVSVGVISATAGLRNDSRFIQVTAPIQPGDSGGPVLDASGHVVGVVVGKFNALNFAAATGTLPENVNFAISARIVMPFLDSQHVAYEAANSNTTLSPPDVADLARPYMVLVECWK
jgi:S1-C subfamily serine protease